MMMSVCGAYYVKYSLINVIYSFVRSFVRCAPGQCRPLGGAIFFILILKIGFERIVVTSDDFQTHHYND